MYPPAHPSNYFRAPRVKATPAHGHRAIMKLIIEAKDSGSPFAEMALTQLGVIMGKQYEFERVVMPGDITHTIVVRP